MLFSNSRLRLFLGILASYGMTIASVLHLPRNEPFLAAVSSTSLQSPAPGSAQCMNPPDLSVPDEVHAAADNFFKNWVETLWKDPYRLAKYKASEKPLMSFFGEENWGTEAKSMYCKLNEDCGDLPSCSTIKQFQLGIRGNRTDEEIERHSEMLFLLRLKYQVFHVLLKRNYDAMDSARTHIALVADSLALDFTRQPDMVQDAHCEMSKLETSMFFQAVFAGIDLLNETEKGTATLVMAGAPEAAPIVKGVQAVAEIAMDAVKSRIQMAQYATNLVNAMNEYHEWEF
ncbi:uncharacterized protein LY89DRAFT_252661 [Mollisia scopiformis]|uniref:Uncharacterized protein n=1 Tax=Mollisia scopiformis TaxID=149040 RepID=A0A194WSN1_MOLSC|nr:uncharacterized protein LY89DRAFT_252661 [Mollisia scopiformis]KUJ10951.1 hypothetical protein LY89DRAFT_252661 [Mollisia scopiformis]